MQPHKPHPKTKKNKLCSKFMKMRYERSLSLKKHDSEEGKHNWNCLPVTMNWTSTSFKCLHILQMNHFFHNMYPMQWRQELAIVFCRLISAAALGPSLGESRNSFVYIQFQSICEWLSMIMSMCHLTVYGSS